MERGQSYKTGIPKAFVGEALTSTATRKNREKNYQMAALVVQARA